MKLIPRSLLSLLALTGAAMTASAQHELYITEAPVTFEITFGTHVRKADDATLTKFTTTPITSRLSNRNIIEQLQATGLIPGTDPTGWQFMAVRGAPADLDYSNGSFRTAVDGGFSLFAVNPTTSAKISLSSVFASESWSAYSIQNYVEVHQGQNILSSRGTVTSLTDVSFTPSFNTIKRRSGTTLTPSGKATYTETHESYSLDSLLSRGYATINYATRTLQPIVFHAIDSVRFNSLGDFTGTATQTVVTFVDGVPENTVVNPNPNDVPTFGLVSLRLTVGQAKLVRLVDYYPAP